MNCSLQNKATRQLLQPTGMDKEWLTHRVVHGVGCEDVEESLLPANAKPQLSQNPEETQSAEPGASLTVWTFNLLRGEYI